MVYTRTFEDAEVTCGVCIDIVRYGKVPILQGFMSGMLAIAFQEIFLNQPTFTPRRPTFNLRTIRPHFSREISEFFEIIFEV